MTPFASSSSKLLTVARYSTTVLLEAVAGSREQRCLDTDRAIIQTAQLGINRASILHAACGAWGNAIFYTVRPTPCACDKKRHEFGRGFYGDTYISVLSVFTLTLREGSGHETSLMLAVCNKIACEF